MVGRQLEQLHPAQNERLGRLEATLAVDVHCHLLPGLDDGPAGIDDSLLLCRALVLDGITHAIATPHQLGRYEGHNTSIQIRREVEKLNQRLVEHAIPLVVAAGAEVRLDERMPQMIQVDDVLLLPDGGDHLLLELPRGAFIDPFPLIRALYFRGITVILAHPERLDGINRRPEAVQRWIDEGAAIQVNAGSLCGHYGQESENVAWQWIEAGWVSLIASDAHSADRRPPCMTHALGLVQQRHGAVIARHLFSENPRRLWHRQQLLPAPASTPGGAV
jgi:protein-tyrosine phosphatase